MIEKAILGCDLTFPVDCSAEAKDLLQSILCLDPQPKSTLQEIKQHPFFSSM
jgi:hypothetical protein